MSSRLRCTPVVLLALLLARPTEAQELVHWRFDTGNDGWAAIPGSEIFPELDRDRPYEGKGSMRWVLTRSDARGNRGVQSPSLSLKGKVRSPHVRFVFAMRASGVRELNLTARTHGNQSFSVPIRVGENWAGFEISSRSLTAPRGDGTLDSRSLADVQIWGTAVGDKAAIWLDDFVIFPEREEGNRGPPEIAGVDPRLAVALPYSALRSEDPDQVPGGLAKELEVARGLGFSALEISVPWWNEIERTREVFTWEWLDQVAEATRAARMGWVVTAGGVLATHRRPPIQVPSDLEFRDRFTELSPRYHRFLDAFFERYRDLVRTFLIPSERVKAIKWKGEVGDDYLQFLHDGMAHVRRIAPEARLGVRASIDDGEEVIRELNKDTDFYAITFQPRGLDFSGIAEELRNVFSLAKRPKKVAILDLSYSSWEGGGSTPQQQASFVRELLRAVKEHAGQLEWLSWWSLKDDDPQLWMKIGAGLVGKDEQATMPAILERCSCGLLSRDGSPKPALMDWLTGVKSLGR